MYMYIIMYLTYLVSGIVLVGPALAIGITGGTNDGGGEGRLKTGCIPSLALKASCTAASTFHSCASKVL